MVSLDFTVGYHTLVSPSHYQNCVTTIDLSLKIVTNLNRYSSNINRRVPTLQEKSHANVWESSPTPHTSSLMVQEMRDLVALIEVVHWLLIIFIL